MISPGGSGDSSACVLSLIFLFRVGVTSVLLSRRRRGDGPPGLALSCPLRDPPTTVTDVATRLLFLELTVVEGCCRFIWVERVGFGVRAGAGALSRAGAVFRADRRVLAAPLCAWGLSESGSESEVWEADSVIPSVSSSSDVSW